MKQKWNLDSPDGWASYLHDLRKEPRRFFSRRQGDGSVMVWAVLFYKEQISFHFTTGRQTSSQITILVCSKFAADLHCKSASLQQIWHDKSASVKQVCNNLTQASKSPWDELAASLHCKLISNYSRNRVRT
ncbi:hypothetical protein AVEN_117793-1 [Araneus ventricosus]|uniref:Uncharacterized protein n=1 Tax=Araneus ventricosus TaxID=182803 RepID=A0A4Y2B862_ARAVE|nr:hypothetical protein AVEN_117793-1 [Araneus ventricosus]